MMEKKFDVEIQHNLDWLQKFKNSNKLFTSRQVGNLFGFSSGTDFEILMARKYKVLSRINNQWYPNLNMDKDFVKLVGGIDNFGEAYMSLRWTAIGVLGVAKMLNLKLKEENLERLLIEDDTFKES